MAKIMFYLRCSIRFCKKKKKMTKLSPVGITKTSYNLGVIGGLGITHYDNKPIS